MYVTKLMLSLVHRGQQVRELLGLDESYVYAGVTRVVTPLGRGVNLSWTILAQIVRSVLITLAGIGAVSSVWIKKSTRSGATQVGSFVRHPQTRGAVGRLSLASVVIFALWNIWASPIFAPTAEARRPNSTISSQPRSTIRQPAALPRPTQPFLPQQSQLVTPGSQLARSLEAGSGQNQVSAVIQPVSIQVAAPQPDQLHSSESTPVLTNPIDSRLPVVQTRTQATDRLSTTARLSAFDSIDAQIAAVVPLAETEVSSQPMADREEIDDPAPSPDRNSSSPAVGAAEKGSDPEIESVPFPEDELAPELWVLVAPEPGLSAAPTPTPAPILSDPALAAAPPAVSAPAAPTPAYQPVYAGPIWPDFIPGAADVQDHYWLQRPFLPGTANDFATPQYQFGSDAGGRYRVHHGVDISNPLGIPTVAVAAGEIVFAGLDTPDILGPYPGFYGNSVVIRLDRRYVTPEGERDVYALYGHLNEVLVLAGQRVEPGQVVGRVGMTGIAIGPHLHLEMRVGNNDYASSVNPLLWVTPPPGAGTIAIRVLTAAGQSWENAKISVIRLDADGTRWLRTINTYITQDSIQPDPAWGENGVMGDMPAGLYILAGTINGERVEAKVAVSAGQTTFVEMRTQQ